VRHRPYTRPHTCLRAAAWRAPESSRRPDEPELITIATIDSLLDKVDSKYSLVHLSARRAREINDYYHSLGEGLGQFTPPLVEQVDSNKPLSIALEEIAAGKIVIQYPGEARRAVEDLLATELSAGDEDDLAGAAAADETAGEVSVLPTESTDGGDEES
jgi:DNA-directed RNA polymerase subunit omega